MPGVNERHNYIMTRIKDLISIRSIATVYFYDFSPDYTSSSDIHDFWEMHYCDSGEYDYLVSGRIHHLKAGDVIFIRPMAHHVVRCDGVHQASVFIITFRCSSPSMKRFSNRVVSVNESSLGHLKNLMKECSDSFVVTKYPLKKREDAGIGAEQLVGCYLEAFIISLLRSELAENADSSKKKALTVSDVSLAEKIEAYLRLNIGRRVSLDELSEVFHFGKSHICEAFRLTYSQTVNRYHTELKVDEAKRMLRETGASVVDIAASLGFESPEYFTRTFKKVTGITPRDMRSTNINERKVKK